MHGYLCFRFACISVLTGAALRGVGSDLFVALPNPGDIQSTQSLRNTKNSIPTPLRKEISAKPQLRKTMKSLRQSEFFGRLKEPYLLHLGMKFPHILLYERPQNHSQHLKWTSNLFPVCVKPRDLFSLLLTEIQAKRRATKRSLPTPQGSNSGKANSSQD